MTELVENRSEELREFMPYTPKWITRVGNTVILGIVIIAIALAQIIRYPEKVAGQVTTSNPTIKLVNKIGGKIEKLFVSDDSLLTKGTVIAEIENSSASGDITSLKEFIDSIRIESDEVFFNLSHQTVTLKLGEAQSDYTYLLSELKGYRELMVNDYYPEKIKALDKQIKTYETLNQINLNNKQLYEQELKNISAKVEMNKKLYQEKVIAVADLNERQNEFLSKKQGFNTIKKSIVEITIVISDLERQKLDLTHEFDERKRSYVIDVARLKSNLNNFINSWTKNYTIISPIEGRVRFSQNISEKQNVTQGETLFIIVPSNKVFVGILSTSSSSIGKIKLDQSVLVSLDGYPVHDFGKLSGRISKLLSTPSKNTYTLYVTFGEKLTSTYGKEIEFKPEMTGVAEIVVDEASFLERILKNMKKLIYN